MGLAKPRWDEQEMHPHHWHKSGLFTFWDGALEKQLFLLSVVVYL